MSTQEDRIVLLERKVAALELRRMYNENLAQENIPPELGRNLREVNENMTILLGVIGKQGLAIRELKEDVDHRFDAVDHRLDTVDQRFDMVDQRFDAVDQRLNTFEQRVTQGFDTVDKKFDLVLQQLATLTKKLE